MVNSFNKFSKKLEQNYVKFSLFSITVTVILICAFTWAGVVGRENSGAVWVRSRFGVGIIQWVGALCCRLVSGALGGI